MSASNAPRGQVLIIAAVGLFALILIAALVIDIGFSWMLHRQEQNAADPGALAAARFISEDPTLPQTIDMPQARAAACYYAEQNGFFALAGGDVTACVPANDVNGATLTVNYPPDANAGQFQGHLGFVQVIISSQHDAFFSRIIGQSQITVTTAAVAARQRGETNTHTLIALAKTGCSTGKIHGTGSVKIYPVPGYTGPGGYVQVNSDCDSGSSDDQCSAGSGALKIDGTADLWVEQRINVHGSCQNKDPSHGTLDEAAVQIGDPLEGVLFPAWDPALDGQPCGVGGPPTEATGNPAKGCGTSAMPWHPSPAANCPGMTTGFSCIELQPGVYFGGWTINTKLHVKLAPGIYIIAGGGVTIKSNGELDSIQAAGGGPAPVLIYNTDNPLASCPSSGAGCQQDLVLGTATSKLKLKGLSATQPCPPATITGGCPFGGMVIWYDADGSQAYNGLIKIEGGGGLYISGTIYAPKAEVDIEGHSGTNCGTGTETQLASVQIIAWTWNLGGTGDLCMPYDPTQLYKLSQQGLVH